jgi:histidyl-tRNA synthetase
MGQERLVELMRVQARTAVQAPHLYLVMAGQGVEERGLELAESLRSALPGLRLQANLGGGSFKAQFKRADRSGAELALVLGEDELRRGEVTVKPLREDAGQQQLALQDLAGWLENWLNDTRR